MTGLEWGSSIHMQIYMHTYMHTCEHTYFFIVPNRRSWRGFYKFALFSSVRLSIINKFSALVCLCFQIFIGYWVHCFALPSYRSSLNLICVHWFFTKSWPLNLEKYHELSIFRNFFLSLLSDIHLIFRTLLCLTTFQIKFWIWFLSFDFSLSQGPWT
jgi:hypothetical protein